MPSSSEDRPITIVVVDDSAVAHAAARAALEAHGYRVVCVDNPLLVPSVVRREKPDVVFVDYEMPAVKGDAVTELIEPLRERLPPFAVYLYSSRPAHELARAANTCGADGYVIKDSAMTTLTGVVERWLRRRKR